MRRRCCTYPPGNSREQSFKSMSDSHLSTAALVCATSQQHFRGQGTQINRAAFKLMGDRATTFELQTSREWSHGHTASGTAHTVLGQCQMSLLGQLQTLLGHHNPPHTATGVGVLPCFRGAALCLWMANLGGFHFPLCTQCWSHSAESQPWWCTSSSSCFLGAKKLKLPIQPRGELDKASTSCLTPAGATLLIKLLCWGNDDAEWFLLFLKNTFSIFLHMYL